jgi:hypothetical protein
MNQPNKNLLFLVAINSMFHNIDSDMETTLADSDNLIIIEKSGHMFQMHSMNLELDPLPRNLTPSLLQKDCLNAPTLDQLCLDKQTYLDQFPLDNTFLLDTKT